MTTCSENSIILLDILYNLYGINISSEQMRENLLSENIGLDAVDLVYLYREIQNKFNIVLPDKYILNGSFSSVDNILEILHDLSVNA